LKFDHILEVVQGRM